MKIGFLSLPLTGHLNPMTALARKLQSRGHEVVFIGVPDIESVVRAARLEFVSFCENEYPPGSVAKRWGGGSGSAWSGRGALHTPGSNAGAD
jgi:UDP:flavonoid glycosyltransferase YjiC (YdhE family)